MSSGTGSDGSEGGLAAAVVAVAERRDRAAFARLFAFYAPRAKAYFRGFGADDATAEALAQDAMLAVWREAARFDPRRTDAATWVFALVRGIGVTGLRRERRPDFDAGDPALIQPAYNVPSEDDAGGGPERVSRAVLAAVERLPDEEAKLLRMFYQGQEVGAAGAGATGVAGGGNPRLRRVLARLREALGGDR
jgi:RNA polymerase sigma-70 factor, ECF subfamily